MYIWNLSAIWGRIHETRVLLNLFGDDDAVEHFVVGRVLCILLDEHNRPDADRFPW